MPLTRASVESVLVARCGKRLALVGLDGTTIDGTNAALADPLASALRSLAIDPASPLAPADADLASLTAGAEVAQLLDVAELRCLESVLGNLDMTDEKAGTDEQGWAKFAQGLQSAIDALRSRVASLYGVGLSAPTIGSVDLNFAESGDPADWRVTT